MSKDQLKQKIRNSKYFPKEFIEDFETDFDELGELLQSQEKEIESLKNKIEDKAIDLKDLFNSLTDIQKYELYMLKFSD